MLFTENILNNNSSAAAVLIKARTEPRKLQKSLAVCKCHGYPKCSKNKARRHTIPLPAMTSTHCVPSPVRQWSAHGKITESGHRYPCWGQAEPTSVLGEQGWRCLWLCSEHTRLWHSLWCLNVVWVHCRTNTAWAGQGLCVRQGENGLQTTYEEKQSRVVFESSYSCSSFSFVLKNAPMSDFVSQMSTLTSSVKNSVLK